jgi:hypothetical protein
LNDLRQPTHPIAHYRGLLLQRSEGWHARYMDVGSKRFLSLSINPSWKLYIVCLFVYGTQKDQTVAIQTKDKGARSLRSIYVKGRFPFIGLRSAKGSYKRLYFKAGFGSVQRLLIKTPSLEKEILVCAEISKDELLRSFSDIARALDKIQTELRLRDEYNLALLERSILTLDPVLQTQTSRKLLVELYCIYLCNHRNAHKLLGSWTAEEEERGCLDEGSEFRQKLDKLTFPLALGRHGFNPSFKNLDLDAVESELHALMQELTNFDVQPFLNSGTLLGYYRDGCPIPHDDDFDLGVLIKGDSEDEVAKHWHDFVHKVSAKYNIINKGSFLALKMTNGVQVDIFCAWTLAGNSFIHPYCWADVSEQCLLPLKDFPIRGRIFKVPCDPESILSVNYGKNWRVPDPFWRFDYRYSKRRFGAFLKKLKTPL